MVFGRFIVRRALSLKRARPPPLRTGIPRSRPSTGREAFGLTADSSSKTDGADV